MWQKGSMTFMGKFPLGSPWALAQSHRLFEEYIFTWLLVILPWVAQNWKGHIASLWTLSTRILSHFEILIANIIFWCTKRWFRSPEIGQNIAQQVHHSQTCTSTQRWWLGPTELVGVSQRGQTSPSVSIIAARRVSLSDPYGEPPSRIRGDAPLPLWPLKPQERTEGSDTVSMIWTHRI